MPTYYPATPFVPQFTTQTGLPLSGGSVSAFVADTTTPTTMYTDAIGTAAGTTITLNSRGEPQVSGDAVVIWLDDSVKYKFVLKDEAGVTIWTVDSIGEQTFGGAFARGEMAVVVDSIADLRALESSKYTISLVTGYYGSGDGGGGTYYLDAQDGASVDNGGTIVVGTDGGRWKLVYDDVISAKQFGAKGDGVSDDTAATAAACTLGVPIFVPQTDDYYSVTTLADAHRELLWGPGKVKVAGVTTQINSVAGVDSDDKAVMSAYRSSLAPDDNTTSGSVGFGALYTLVTRSGGFGQYGNWLSTYQVTAETPAGQFDSGITSWVTHSNLTGGQLFGMWAGANTPSSELSQTYSSGTAIGMEINVGNRWGDFGLLTDVAATRCTVGVQIVPDVVPSQGESPPEDHFPGSFGEVFGASVHGHKWWVATMIRYDTLMTGGIAHLDHGGSVIGNAPDAHTRMIGYWDKGLDFSGASFSTAAIKFGSNQTVGTATAGGGATLPATVFGYLRFNLDGTAIRVPYYRA